MSEILNNENTLQNQDMKPSDEKKSIEPAALDTVDSVTSETGSDAGADAMREWSQAMAEQQSGTAAQKDQNTVEAANVFKPLEPVSAKSGEGFDLDLLKDIPVQLSVELGRVGITIRELLQLNQGSVVELANLAGEPMDIYINNLRIAQGEVVIVGDNYGVRLTDIITPSERLSRLSAKH